MFCSVVRHLEGKPVFCAAKLSYKTELTASESNLEQEMILARPQLLFHIWHLSYHLELNVFIDERILLLSL
jgi:hypothetical protein